MYKARCLDNNAIVAIKVLKLEDPSINLEDTRKEVLTMKLCDHDNVLTCYCCFNVGCSLLIVTPLMIKGSFLRILQYLSSQKRIQDGQGFEECIVAYIIRETAKALKYLHDSNLLHRYLFHPFSHRRDVKAGNILVDADANIRLADLGVARVLEGTVKKQEARTFVGTPCWMAPEVMNRERYNSRVPLVVSLSSPSGRYLVSRHHGVRALQRLSALSEVRADGDSDPHRPRRVALLRLLQRFLSH